jgi:ketosteroid isomerase-like protein
MMGHVFLLGCSGLFAFLIACGSPAVPDTRAEASKGGDFVYTIGTYSMTVSNPKDKKPITDRGKYLTVFKKQPDGTWKMVADMINSDLPLPGVAQ